MVTKATLWMRGDHYGDIATHQASTAPLHISAMLRIDGCTIVDVDSSVSLCYAVAQKNA
jgi:hypothetical protein